MEEEVEGGLNNQRKPRAKLTSPPGCTAAVAVVKRMARTPSLPKKEVRGGRKRGRGCPI